MLSGLINDAMCGFSRSALLCYADVKCDCQTSRVKLDARWRNTPTRTEKLCTSLDAHMPASWPAELRRSFLGGVQSTLTDLWESIKPPKVHIHTLTASTSTLPAAKRTLHTSSLA